MAGDTDKPLASIPQPSISNVVSQFITQISSLYSTLPVLMKTLNEALKDNTKEFLDFIKNSCKPAQEGNIAVPSQLHGHWLDLRRKTERVALANRIVPNSFLVSLVSQYDSYLGNLIRCLFYARPELLMGSDRSLTFKELSEFGTLSEARDSLIEREVETVIRKSHSEQFDWMEGKFKALEDKDFSLRKGLASWPTFIELTERRNLFVHCDGVVSPSICGFVLDIRSSVRIWLLEQS
jgi:hypothetical protein